MALVFSSVLTESEILYCRRLLLRHTNKVNFCNIWVGTKDKDGYGVVRIQFRGSRVKLKTHRLSFYIENNFPSMVGKHVSHLCHNKACSNTSHLSLETAAINNKRKQCLQNGECVGHYGFKRCILRYMIFLVIC